MANIGDLNKRLKERVAEKHRETETLIQQELQSFTKSLRKEYQAGLNTISADIRDQNQKLQTELNTQKQQTEKLISEIRKRATLGWIKSSLIAVSVLIVILGSSWGLMRYLSNRIQTQLVEIEQNQQTLAELNRAGGWIKLNRCGEKRLICAQIDENAPEYQRGYRVLKGQ